MRNRKLITSQKTLGTKQTYVYYVNCTIRIYFGMYPSGFLGLKITAISGGFPVYQNNNNNNIPFIKLLSDSPVNFYMFKNLYIPSTQCRWLNRNTI